MKLNETDPVLLELMNGILKNRLTDNVYLQKTLCFRLRREAARQQSHFAACFAECYLADYYVAALDSKHCFRQLAKALNICKASGYTELMLFVYNLYGVAYSTNGEGGMAIDYFLEGIAEASRIHSNEYLAKFYCNIGDSFLRLHQYDEAWKYSKKAQALFRRCKGPARPEGVGYVIISNLADSLLGMGQPRKALELIDDYIRRDPQGGSDLVLHVQRGCALAQLGSWSDALEEFLQFEYDRNAPADRELYADTLIRISNLAIAAGEFDHARRCRMLLDRFTPYDNSVIMLHICEVDICFYTAVGPEQELSSAYAEYYRLSKEIELTSERERAQSIKDRIKLYHTIEENVEILQHNKQLKDMSGVDELSRLPNRRALNEKLAAAVDAAAGVNTVGTVVFDIDRFKNFNDKHGHLVGDRVLKLAACCLMDDDSRFYPTRFGGDEFITVCTGCTDEDIAAYIERCFERLRERQGGTDGSLSRVTLSAGYFNAAVPRATNADTLIMRADQALYEAKCRSRDCYISYSELYKK